MTAWVVRAGPNGMPEEKALSDGIAGISFHVQQPVTDFPKRNDLREIIENRYEEPRRRAGNFAGQLWSFAHKIRNGDTVVMPRNSPKPIAVGRVSGDYEYRPDLEAPHVRSVDWIAPEIPRIDFEQEFPGALHPLATVFCILTNDAESRIDSIVARHLGTAPDSPGLTYPPNEDQEFEAALEERISNRIAARIRQRFSGTKLGYLVASILRASGYSVLETRHGPDGYIDVVAGLGDMGFGRPRLCVRVKSVPSPVDLPGYNRLQDDIGAYGADHGLMVSLSDFTEEARAENELSFFQIRLWGPGDLVDKLLETYDNLPDDIRSEIPIRKRGILIEAEE